MGLTGMITTLETPVLVAIALAALSAVLAIICRVQMSRLLRLQAILEQLASQNEIASASNVSDGIHARLNQQAKEHRNPC